MKNLFLALGLAALMAMAAIPAMGASRQECVYKYCPRCRGSVDLLDILDSKKTLALQGNQSQPSQDKISTDRLCEQCKKKHRREIAECCGSGELSIWDEWPPQPPL